MRKSPSLSPALETSPRDGLLKMSSVSFVESHVTNAFDQSASFFALLAGPGSSLNVPCAGRSGERVAGSNPAGCARSQLTGIASDVSGVTRETWRVSSDLAFVSVNRTSAVPRIVGANVDPGGAGAKYCEMPGERTQCADTAGVEAAGGGGGGGAEGSGAKDCGVEAGGAEVPPPRLVFRSAISVL